MKNVTLIIFFCLLSISVAGQNDVILDKKYYKNGNLASETSLIKKGNTLIRDGKTTVWYASGELKNITNFKENELDGERISYWRNGVIKRKDFFKKGKLKGGKCFDEEGNEVAYYGFEIQPEFPGGNKALNEFIEENLIYKTSNISGKLLFRFTIESNGKASNLKILKDTSPSVKNELIAMFNSMPIWSPANQDGIPVRVVRTIPVNFQ